MKRLAAAFLVFLMTGCDEEPSRSLQVDWKKLGLDGKTVNEMQVVGPDLYVATTTGLFKLPDTSGDFQAIGFDGKNVEAIEAFGDGELMVSVFDKTGAEAPALFKTVNDGISWDKIESNFGGGFPEPVLDLEQHHDNPNILFATGYAVVASSHDQGLTWEPLYGEWGGFATGLSVVEMNPLNDELWAGGQGGIENGILLHSEHGVDWNMWSDLVENPTVVKEITFSNTDGDELYVGFEGALLKTNNNGQTWQTLIHSQETRFFFGIRLGTEDPQRVYTGGWLKTSDPQPLILYISEDGGKTWNERRLPSEQFGGILEMQIKKYNGKDVIFLGLDKGGVYQLTVSN